MDIVGAMSSRAQRLQKEPVGAGDPGPGGGDARGPKRRGHALLKLIALGGVVALAAKPEVRNRLLDALFGPEEQFEYESVTEPVAAPIASIASEPRAAAEVSASGAAAAAAPLREDSWYRSWDAPSADPKSSTDGPAEARSPLHGPWSRGGEDALSTDAEEPSPVEDDGAAADSPDAPAPPGDAWSRIEAEAGAGADADADAQDSAAPDRAIWSRLEDAGAPWSAGAEQPVSPAADAAPGAGDQLASAPPAPAGGENPNVSGGETHEPAIGEADSPRNGWWIPRRRRSESVPEPPRPD
jgi:hypothetical protein